MTDDLEQEIQQTREHLGETVDALAAKLEADKRQAGVALAAAGVLAAGVVAAILLWPKGR